tara:strand:+ start:21552 stop:22415 length:864 start_codon:yes stop_codon:yes gene_type:complete
LTKLTLDDLSTALREIIPDDDEVIVMHSGVWSFALAYGWTRPEDVDPMIDILTDIIGADRTLIMPAYNFDFYRTKQFDLVRSLPQVGVLPDRAWRRMGMVRTRQPMNSYFVVGPRSDEVVALPCTTAWGDDSVLGWMQGVNARICILGVSWEEGCSFIHRCEEKARVPYRYFKRFPGTLFDDGRKIGPCSEVLYSRPLAIMLADDWSSITDPLRASGDMLTTSNPKLHFESALSQVVYDQGMAVLEQDPYILLPTADGLRDRVRAWVKNDKKAEMAALAPEQRWPQD